MNIIKTQVLYIFKLFKIVIICKDKNLIIAIV